MAGQRRISESSPIDAALLEAAGSVIARHGYGGLTLARLAESAGVARMTLHRRGITIAAVVEAMSLQAASELGEAFLPILSSRELGAARLRSAVDAMLDLADRNLPLLAGLFAADEGIFHAEPTADGSLPTDALFVDPLARLLADGAEDGSLAPCPDPVETATVLFNLAGWGYVQLRHAQRWPARRARDGVMAMVFEGLRTPPG